MYSTLHYVQYIKHIVHSLGAFVHNLVKEMPHSMFAVLTIIDSNMIVICETFFNDDSDYFSWEYSISRLGLGIMWFSEWVFSIH